MINQNTMNVNPWSVIRIPNYQNSTQLDIQLKDDKRNFRVL